MLGNAAQQRLHHDAQPDEFEAYKEGPQAYEFKGTNGFMLTFDMTAKDVAPQKGSMGY